MSIMNAVWPLTMLYRGPLGLIVYFWFGPAETAQHRGSHGADLRHAGPPMWQSAFKGATHCGAGCALGDFAGEWLAFATNFTILSSSLTGRFAMSFMFAYVLGIGFQYLSIVPMRELRPREGVIAAIKVDTLSLLAYENGMFSWMAMASRIYPQLRPTNPSYWLMMQIAMQIGFATTYPVNWWLISRGTKEKMQLAKQVKAIFRCESP